MIRQYELIDKILKYNPQADVALLNRAYVFSMKAHGNQKRASGQPYLIHPLEVAAILADLKLDDASIAAGLLHDTIEDTLATYDEIKTLFGEEIALLVEGVTKLSRIKFNNKAVEQAENFRKLLLAMSKDIRILLVKLADRLHNMRTIEHVKSPEKRAAKAQETMDIYTPLADRIGLYNIKTELEDISFRHIKPDEYVRIEKRMAFLRAQSTLVDKVIAMLKDELEKAGIEAQVFGRTKTAYSIYRKMVKKNLTFDQLTDIVAYRIIVKDKPRCYEVLGLIHNIYKAIPGRFKDYISNPKPNGYQSLHTSLIGPFGNRMEIQIREEKMHEIAEAGVAAHWLYKQESGANPAEGSKYKWLKQLMDMLQTTDDPEEFLENTKMDLFKEYVFVFTPQGDLINLPNGATPLDFAYEIHSEVGNRCQTAKVNGRVVPLRTRLENGDQVEVITAKNQSPSPGWREFVVTGKAKTAINRFLRAQQMEEQVALGRDILEKAAKREHHKLTEKKLQRVLSDLKMPTLEEAYAALAQGRLFPRQIFSVLFPKEQEAPEASVSPKSGEGKGGAASVSPSGDETAIGIDGLTPGLAIHIAKCCNPLPGESIVGIINTGRGVSIHARNCRNLEALSDQPDRWLPVRWSDAMLDKSGKFFQARLRVTMNHTPGALSSFSTEIYNAEGNIVDLHIETRASDTYVFRCEVEVKNLNHFEKLLSGLRSLSCVHHVERVSG